MALPALDRAAKPRREAAERRSKDDQTSDRQDGDQSDNQAVLDKALSAGTGLEHAIRSNS